MMTMATKILRWAMCLLGIAVLLLVGVLGEELLNVLHSRLGQLGSDPALPSPTAFVVRNYPLNTGHFTMSLTPFMIALLGLAVLTQRKDEHAGVFWYIFGVISLLAVAYVCLFTTAILLPFHLLLTEMGRSPLWTAVLAVNGVLVMLIMVVCVLKRRRSRAEPTDRQVLSESAPSASSERPSS